MAKIYYNDNGTWKVVNIPGGGSSSSIDADTLNGLLNAGDGISIEKTTAGEKVEIKIDKLNDFLLTPLGKVMGVGNATRYLGFTLTPDPKIKELTPVGVSYYTFEVGAPGNRSIICKDNLRTIFGNQSIVGSGNIDLFNHDITIKGTDSSIDGVYEVHVFKTSSNNLNVNSLTDLKTLLGNTFKYWNVNGWLQNNLDSRSEMAIYVTESSVAFQSPTSSEYTISLAGATFTDDVTTV